MNQSISSSDFGMKLAGSETFLKFRFYSQDVAGIPGMCSWNVGVFKPDPNVVLNRTLGNIEIGSVTWQPGQLTLHPGHFREETVVRVPCSCEGLIAVVADFVELGPFGKGVEVGVTMNGTRLWRSATDDRFAAFMNIDGHSVIDFSVGVGPGDTYADSTVALRFAIFRVVEATDDRGRCFERIDDNISNLDGELALQWLEAADAADILQPPPASGKTTARWFAKAAMRYLDPPNRKLIEQTIGRTIPELIDRILTQPSVQPKKSYVLFFTPRSGSTMLTEIISKAKCLGFPNEYFVENIATFFSVLNSVTGNSVSLTDFISRHCCSENGVFGVEIEYDRFSRLERSIVSDLGNVPVIYMTRFNLLAQAISLFLAAEGNQWSSFDGDRRDIAYDREKIISYLKVIITHMKGFENFFEESNIEPVRLYYEDVVKNPSAEIGKIAAALDVPEFSAENVDLSSLTWKVVRTTINAHFTTSMMSEGGEVFGYTLFDQGSEIVAVLTGLDISELPRIEYEYPLVFRGPDRDAVCEAIRIALSPASAPVPQ